jgi:hypothetical protein
MPIPTLNPNQLMPRMDTTLLLRALMRLLPSIASGGGGVPRGGIAAGRWREGGDEDTGRQGGRLVLSAGMWVFQSWWCWGMQAAMGASQLGGREPRLPVLARVTLPDTA